MRPSLLGCFNIAKQAQVALGDHPMIDQGLEIDDIFPKGAAKEHDRDRFDLACLDERQQLKHFIKSAKPARENGNATGAQ